MIKKSLFLISFIWFLAVLTSCGWSEMSRNNKNLSKLNTGMTKDQVLAVMGEPLKHEVFNTDNVWYYYTETKWSDGMITRDECTPVFFKDEKLAGWGQAEYKKFVHEKW